jgi:hypothetical protein
MPAARKARVATAETTRIERSKGTAGDCIAAVATGVASG